MTREEVINALADDLWYNDLGDVDPGMDFFKKRAGLILDWLDSIGYYNMHFYGVASKNAGPPEESRKE